MACTVGDVAELVELLAPVHLAREDDNVGLIVGDPRGLVEGVLVTLDVTPEVLEEAYSRKAGLVVSHHPPVFRGLRRVITDTATGKVLREALKRGISIYAAHTNLDVCRGGVNTALAEIFGLQGDRPLLPADHGYSKLVTTVPPEAVEEVSEALFNAGAGNIGRYRGCSFRVEGEGTFIPAGDARPYSGERGKMNAVREIRLEVRVERGRVGEAVRALLASHPYEEPAFDVYPLAGPAAEGMGRVGEIPGETTAGDLAEECRRLLGSPLVRLAGDPRRRVKRLAVCGGRGGHLLSAAREAGAEALVTGDVDHHQALEARALGLALIDAGHYHTERPVVERLARFLQEEARRREMKVEVYESAVDTGPWSYGGGDERAG